MAEETARQTWSLPRINRGQAPGSILQNQL